MVDAQHLNFIEPPGDYCLTPFVSVGMLQASQPAAHDALPGSAELAAVKIQPTGLQHQPTRGASNLGQFVQIDRPQVQQKSAPRRQLPQTKQITPAAFAQPQLQQAAPAASPWPQPPQEPTTVQGKALRPQPPQTRPGESFRNRSLKLLQNAGAERPNAMAQLTSPAGSSMQCPCGRPSVGLMLSCVHCQAVWHPECASRCVPGKLFTKLDACQASGCYAASH